MLRKRNVRKNNAERCFAKSKLQSAMEYLMTYGWAILIIAVVLGALFQLGVFNANNFAPKAPPGACQVFRPNGPGTTSFINLEGICSGELPQYVAQFNGGSSYIQPSSGVLGGTSALTVSLWFNAKSLATGGAQYGWIDEEGVWGLKFGQPNIAYLCFATTAGGWAWCAQWNLPSFSTNTWYFIAATYNSGSPTEFYVDGIQYPGPTESGVMTTGTSGPLQIGPAISNQGDSLNGYIANVQIYNTSLSANDIQALYQEGIGGAPIDLQHLVGWWPLNGNANDYSGNGNNGAMNNVNFVSNWWSGYTPP